MIDLKPIIIRCGEINGSDVLLEERLDNNEESCNIFDLLTGKMNDRRNHFSYERQKVGSAIYYCIDRSIGLVANDVDCGRLGFIYFADYLFQNSQLGDTVLLYGTNKSLLNKISKEISPNGPVFLEENGSMFIRFKKNNFYSKYNDILFKKENDINHSLSDSEINFNELFRKV